MQVHSIAVGKDGLSLANINKFVLNWVNRNCEVAHAILQWQRPSPILMALGTFHFNAKTAESGQILAAVPQFQPEARNVRYKINLFYVQASLRLQLLPIPRHGSEAGKANYSHFSPIAERVNKTGKWQRACLTGKIFKWPERVTQTKRCNPGLT